jgi:hypothetical protein
LKRKFLFINYLLQTFRYLTLPIARRAFDFAALVPFNVANVFADNNEFVDSGIKNNLAANNGRGENLEGCATAARAETLVVTL